METDNEGIGFRRVIRRWNEQRQWIGLPTNHDLFTWTITDRLDLIGPTSRYQPRNGVDGRFLIGEDLL